jgi:hypothetical protein
MEEPCLGPLRQTNATGPPHKFRPISTLWGKFGALEDPLPCKMKNGLLWEKNTIWWLADSAGKLKQTGWFQRKCICHELHPCMLVCCNSSRGLWGGSNLIYANSISSVMWSHNSTPRLKNKNIPRQSYIFILFINQIQKIQREMCPSHLILQAF